MAETLGERIRRKRVEADLGLREMAKKLDISPTYLSRIETDEERNPPSEDTLRDIARVLDDNFDELMHLAGRVPSDVSEIIKKDEGMPQFLRTASQRGLKAEDLAALLAKKDKKR